MTNQPDLKEILGFVSPYTVSDDGPITPQIFEYLSGIAEQQVTTDGADLPDALRIHAQALLIAHLIESRAGNLDKISETIGDYRYQRATAGSSAYLVDYQRIIAGNRKPAVASVGVRRADASMQDLQLDDNVLPEHPPWGLL